MSLMLLDAPAPTQDSLYKALSLLIDVSKQHVVMLNSAMQPFRAEYRNGC